MNVNQEFFGVAGETLFAKDTLWIVGTETKKIIRPILNRGDKVSGFLYDDDGDVLIRHKGRFLVCKMEFLSREIPPPQGPVGPEAELKTLEKGTTNE